MVVLTLSEKQVEISFYYKQYLSTIEMDPTSPWEDEFPEFKESH